MPEKYKDEIEEILKNAGELAPSKIPRESERHPEDRPRGRESRDVTRSRQTSVPHSEPSRSLPAITPGKLMLVGVILLLIGFKFWPLIWLGLAILAGGYMMYFVAPQTLNYEKRWRGQSVDEPPTSQWDRLKHWIMNR